ncbi:MAG: hypothetical protein HQL33_01500 [Alphaproteobacteria bacterium]|nr:hypothetical protein [Alphaproteobacteria bacterium]MBF0128644.1 hypothetical protein [Alphaproteobacteria bacterium]
MYRQLRFERADNDAYYTPDWCTEVLLAKVRFRGAVWEPASGKGRMAAVLRRAGYPVVESDIDPSTTGESLDFLTCGAMAEGTSSVVTNPPYHIGTNFVRHALALALPRGGMVAMLLRHEFDCAKTRRPLFERPEFRIKLVLTTRPRWIAEDTGNSPRHNFSWYVWDAAHQGPPQLGWVP